MSNVSAGLKALGQSASVTNIASGIYTGDGVAGALTVGLGFTPRYVRVEDLTDGMTYEWFEGLPATNAILTTWSTGTKTLDTNGTILTNMVIATQTVVAQPAPGAQSPDDGVNGTTTVSYEAPNQALPRLQFVAGASGARMNVASSAYVWTAIG